MSFDLRTLAFALGLTLVIQLVAIAIQYALNRETRGLKPWLWGCVLIASGTLLWPFYRVGALRPLVLMATPLTVAGQMLLTVGIQDFLGRPRTWRLFLGAYAVFLGVYYHGIFVTGSVSRRASAFGVVMGLVALRAVYDLFRGREPGLRASMLLTGVAFLLYGTFSLVRAGASLLMPPLTSVEQQTPLQVMAYLVPLATSSLWTLGFILMNNQRLHAGMQQEKRRLRESEETYRSILEASPDDITLTDLEGRVVMMSPVAHELFGYPPGEEQGLNILDCVSPEEVDRARVQLRELVEGKQHGTLEYRARRKDGTLFEVEVNGGIIPGADGAPARLVFMARDISERRRMEAERVELEARNRQLEKAESLARMAGAIAHHFNNQMQTVVNNLEMVASRHPEATRTPWLARAHQATDRASEVSHLMLAYLGQRPGERVPLHLVGMCNRLRAGWEASLGVVLAWEMPDPLPGPVVQGDEEQLAQALQNLLRNALEASAGAAPQIRVRVSVASAADVPVRHRFPLHWQPPTGSIVQIEVEDRGVGIHEADFDKLFDPFWSTRFTGRGLGLPVVLGIAQAHGGAVSVASEVGCGSVFRIHLPLCGEPVAEPLTGPLGGAPRRDRCCILAVDDDPLLLESLGVLLEALGYQALTATGGEEAVAHVQARGGDICCVITDLTMPGMDGWQTLEALRALDPGLPAIMISGYDRSQAMDGDHAERPQAFLGKPFGLKKLKAVLDEVLGAS